jgi:hypothetical protein
MGQNISMSCGGQGGRCAAMIGVVMGQRNLGDICRFVAQAFKGIKNCGFRSHNTSIDNCEALLMPPYVNLADRERKQVNICFDSHELHGSLLFMREQS